MLGGGVEHGPETLGPRRGLLVLGEVGQRQVAARRRARPGSCRSSSCGRDASETNISTPVSSNPTGWEKSMRSRTRSVRPGSQDGLAQVARRPQPIFSSPHQDVLAVQLDHRIVVDVDHGHIGNDLLHHFVGVAHRGQARADVDELPRRRGRRCTWPPAGGSPGWTRPRPGPRAPPPGSARRPAGRGRSNDDPSACSHRSGPAWGWSVSTPGGTCGASVITPPFTMRL